MVPVTVQFALRSKYDLGPVVDGVWTGFGIIENKSPLFKQARKQLTVRTDG